jgi:hypothetical protein
MHPATLFLALRDAGMSARLLGSKLLINPVASLTGELREQVITHRQGLIDWLAAADDDEARADALFGVAEPLEEIFADGLAVVRTHTLLKASLPGEPPEYAAVDGGWLDHLLEYAAVCRRHRAEKEKRRKSKPTQEDLPCSPETT